MKLLYRLKQMSRVVMALSLVLISTGMFAVWWMFLKPRDPKEMAAAALEAETKANALLDEIRSHANSLFLAGSELMEADTGKVLVKNFMRGAAPQVIWFDEKEGKFIGRFPSGFIRFTHDGKTEKELGSRYGVQISDDMGMAVYSEGGNIHISEIDWQKFELVNQRRITSIGGFLDAFVLKNIMMASRQAMIINNMNQMVRVDLKSGTVTPVKMPMTQAEERRSPDGGLMIIVEEKASGQILHMYDVATDTAKAHSIGNTHLTAALWLGQMRCCLLINGNELIGFDRERGTFEKLMSLPKGFTRLAAASPTGRFVFCLGINFVGIADLEKKNFIPVNFPPQNLYWIADDTLLMARDVQSTEYRGTWQQKLDGSEAVRVSVEPYAFDPAGPGASVLEREGAQMAIFGTKGGYFKMNLRSTDVKELATCNAPSFALQNVLRWQK